MCVILFQGSNRDLAFSVACSVDEQCLIMEKLACNWDIHVMSLDLSLRSQDTNLRAVSHVVMRTLTMNFRGTHFVTQRITKSLVYLMACPPLKRMDETRSCVCHRSEIESKCMSQCFSKSPIEVRTCERTRPCVY
jgi:hypothetical protein